MLAEGVAARGHLGRVGQRLIVSLGDVGGIAAFERFSGAEMWRVSGVPALAAISAGVAYGYARAGNVVVLDRDGVPRWRALLPDDRSAQGIARRDCASRFVADVLANETSVVVAAGATLLKLDARNGEVVQRVSVANGERDVIARVAAAADGGFVATCTERSDWDDELYVPQASIWHAAPAHDTWRTAPSSLVALDAELRVRWRVAPPEPDMVFGDRRPTVDDSGRIALVAARTAGAGAARHVLEQDDCVVCFDYASGQVMWMRDAPGGRGYVDPVLAGGTLVAGYDPTCYDLETGAVRWTLSARALQLNRHVAPVVDGGRLLYMASQHVLMVATDDGSPSALAALPVEGSGDAVTTTLALAGDRLYFGLQPAGRPPGIEVIELPR